MEDKILGWTTIQQSEELVSAGLDSLTADMCYSRINDVYGYVETPIAHNYNTGLPCWSLGALINVLPKQGKYEPKIDINYNRISYTAADDDVIDELWFYEDGESLIDVLVKTIIRLLNENYIKKL